MQILQFETHEEWMRARERRVTGSKLNDTITVKGNGKKKGYYQLIADRMSIGEGYEDPRMRGHRLEPIAMQEFAKLLEKEVDQSLVMWARDDNESIAISPDGVISETEAVEVKCLDAAGHIESLLTNDFPSKDRLKYTMQKYQYFIVNDSLQTLYSVFYNPSLIKKKLFYHVTHRKDIGDKIEQYLKIQRDMIAEIDEIVTSLTF